MHPAGCIFIYGSLDSHGQPESDTTPLASGRLRHGIRRRGLIRISFSIDSHSLDAVIHKLFLLKKHRMNGDKKC